MSLSVEPRAVKLADDVQKAAQNCKNQPVVRFLVLSLQANKCPFCKLAFMHKSKHSAAKSTRRRAWIYEHMTQHERDNQSIRDANYILLDYLGSEAA
jgi:hypothetical protein